MVGIAARFPGPMRVGVSGSPAARSLLILSLLPLAHAAAAAEEADRPLPDPRALIEGVRQTLRSDQALLADYTFIETHVQAELDSKGRVQKTKTEVFEVYPSADSARMYRRLIERDGKPLDPEELARRDRKEAEKSEKKRLRREHESAEDQARRLAREEENLRREREVVDELFRMDEIRVVGRETIDGRSTCIVEFRPRPGYEPRTQGGKVLKKIAGRAWIDEEDLQLVRVEGQLLDGLGVGPGRIFRLKKGAKAFFQRRKLNGEAWLPIEGRFVGAAKILFVTVGRVDVRSRYSDHKKFSVATEEQISGHTD
jgi:hypothetical protein